MLARVWPSLFWCSGLQDNPWYCDCRISKLIEFSKIVDNAVVLLDPFVACSGPESLAGILFQRAELEQCLKPSVMTSATKITSPLGSNVLLRCDATGYPTPQLIWVRSDNLLVNYTGIYFQEVLLLVYLSCHWKPMWDGLGLGLRENVGGIKHGPPF